MSFFFSRDDENVSEKAFYLLKFCEHCGLYYPSCMGEIHVCPEQERDPLLQERQKTYGDFGHNAEISQRLKALFREYGAHGFCDVHIEALDMIALKLSRILSGQANYRDHWDDIAGYSKLASEACKP